MKILPTKWREKITITKLVIGTIIGTTLLCALISGAMALQEIYRQKSRDTWALVFLDLERMATRLAADIASLSSGATTPSVYRMGSGKGSPLEHVSGPQLPIETVLELGVKSSAFKEKRLSVTQVNGQGLIVRAKRGRQLELRPVDFSALLRFPQSLQADTVLLLANRSERLVYSTKPMPESWIARPLVQKYIAAPLWQGQFEYEDEQGQIIHGFFHEVPGTNLVMFAEIPLSTVLATIIDPSKRFALVAASIVVLAVLLLWFPIRLLSKPVQELKTIARQVGEGNFEVTTGESIGEFGELQKAFKHMAQNLQARDDEIQAYMVAQAEKVRLEGELKVASHIQQNFLPQKNLPSESGLIVGTFYESATEVGGDWFGHHYDPYTENSAVVLIDVSGHGAAPCMLTALVAGLFSELCRKVDYDTLCAFLAAANRSLLRHGAQHWHATAIAALYQKKNQKLTLINAGHQFPLVRTKGDKVRSVPMSSTPLGISPDLALCERELDFPESSQAFLFTDGLIEAVGPQGKQYGRKRLFKVVDDQAGKPVSQIVRRLHGEWGHHLNTLPAEDDTCIIGLEAS